MEGPLAPSEKTFALEPFVSVPVLGRERRAAPRHRQPLGSVVRLFVLPSETSFQGEIADPLGPTGERAETAGSAR